LGSKNDFQNGFDVVAASPFVAGFVDTSFIELIFAVFLEFITFLLFPEDDRRRRPMIVCIDSTLQSSVLLDDVFIDGLTKLIPLVVMLAVIDIIISFRILERYPHRLLTSALCVVVNLQSFVVKRFHSRNSQNEERKSYSRAIITSAADLNKIEQTYIFP
jgi:hypothetical protein